MKSFNLKPSYQSLFSFVVAIFFSCSAFAVVTGTITSRISHNTSATSNSIVNYSVSLSNGWIQNSSQISSLKLYNVTSGSSVLVYTHSGYNINYGTISNLTPGIYQYVWSATTIERSGMVSVVTTSPYIWVGYKAEWEQSFDMQEGADQNSTKRTIKTPGQTYSYAQSFNVMSSTSGDCWMELRKSAINTTSDSRVYWVLEPLANPSTFNPSNNITYLEFKTVNGATTVHLKYKAIGASVYTTTTTPLSTNPNDRFRLVRKAGVTSLQMNNSNTNILITGGINNLLGNLRVTVLAKEIGDEAVEIATSFGYPSTNFPISSTFNTTTQVGSIVNNIAPISGIGITGPYHYLISQQALPSYSYLYKSIKDSLFQGTLDSTKFFLGNVSGTQFTHTDLTPGNYFVSVYDSRGVRIYNNTIALNPLTIESNTGTSRFNNTFTCSQNSSKITFENYLTDQEETAEMLFYPTNTNSQSYFGLMNTGTALSTVKNIEYGFNINAGSVYMIQAGVVGTTAHAVKDNYELKLVKKGATLEFWVEGVLKTTSTLPSMFTYKTGIATTVWGTQVVYKPTLFKSKMIKQYVTTELGSCFGSLGKVTVVLSPFSTPTHTMSNFNVTLKNASNQLQTLDAGGNSLNYSFSNLLPGTYTITTTYNWVPSPGNTTTTSVTNTQTVNVDSKIAWENYNQTIYSSTNESLYKNASTAGVFCGNSTTKSIVSSNANMNNYVDFKLNQTDGLISVHALNWSNPNLTTIPTIPTTGICFIRVGDYYFIYNLALGTPVGSYNPTDKFRYSYTTTTNSEKLQKVLPSGFLGSVISTITSDAKTNLTAYVGSGKILNTGFYNMSTNLVCYIPPKLYAKLNRNLTGVNYKGIDNKIHFSYEEEYTSSTNLSYSVFNKNKALVLSNTTMPITKENGDNRYSLDITTLPLGNYILEVINNKNEKFYLRFSR